MGHDHRPDLAQLGARRLVQAQEGKALPKCRVVTLGNRRPRGLAPSRHLIHDLELLRRFSRPFPRPGGADGAIAVYARTMPRED